MVGPSQTAYSSLAPGDGSNPATSGGPLLGSLASSRLAPLIALSVGLLFPICTLIGTGMAKRPNGGSFDEGWKRTLPNVGIVVGCILLVAYSATLLVTSAKDAKIRNGYEQSLQHEGRYFALLAGKPWPEAPGK